MIYGDDFPHLIGFCYSLLYINNKNFIFLPPYIPNIDYPESLEEEFNSELLSENKSYVEPIIFNSHVSLIFIKVTDNIRDNILIDMSKFHCKNKIDKIIFPDSIRKNLKIYPKSPIQIYNSCSLWFYGQINLLLQQNSKYKSIIDINNNIYKDELTYYLDVINLISNKFQNTSIFNVDIIEDPNKLYFPYFTHILCIDKDIIYNNILDFKLFLEIIYSAFFSYKDLNFIIECQQLIKEFREFKLLVNLNINYKKFILKECDFDLTKYEDKCQLFIETFCIRYCETFSAISKKLIKPFISSNNKFKKIFEGIVEKLKLKLDDEIIINYDLPSQYSKIFNEIKENFNMFTIYDQESIISFINSPKNMIYKIMSN